MLVLIYLIIFAVLLSLDANSSRRFTALEFIMSVSPFIWTVDFWIRFIAQQTPSQIIKPYVLMPIPRYACIDSFIISSLLSLGNLVWFALLIPFCLMSVVFSYGLLPALSLLLLFYLMILVDSQWYSICRTLITNHILYLLLPLSVNVAIFLPWILGDYGCFSTFYAKIGTGMEHGQVIPHIIALAILALLIVINRRLQYINVWKELGKQRVKKLKSVSRLSFFDHYGEIGEYLKIEVKSLMRNKNPRKIFIYATVAVIVLSAIISTTDVYDSSFMTNFWAFYNFVIYGGMLLARIMGYEGNYIDVLMVHKENILKLLIAKYYFFCGLLIIPFLLMLPTVIVGKWNVFMLLSYGLFTAGFQYFLLMQTAVYNKQKIPLNEKMISKNGIESNYFQLATEMAAMILPAIFISLLETIMPTKVAWLLIMAFGLTFIISHKLWLRNIYQRMMRRKYVHLEAFHK